MWDTKNVCPCCSKKFCIGCNKENVYSPCLKAALMYSLYYKNINYNQFFFHIDSFFLFCVFCLLLFPAVLSSGFLSIFFTTHSKRSSTDLFDYFLHNRFEEPVYYIFYFVLYSIGVIYLIPFEIIFSIIFIGFVVPIAIITGKVKKMMNFLYNLSMVIGW